MIYIPHYSANGEVAAPSLRALADDTHKYQRGHALVFSGPSLKTGASRLAAGAALRIGAGLVTIVGAYEALKEHAAQVTAIMLAYEGGDQLADERVTSMCIGPGCGVGKDTQARVLRILDRKVATVLDADALTSFADCRDTLIAAMHPNCVLTPHEGEFARLFPEISLLDPAMAAREAADLMGCTLLLKGPLTQIADSDGRWAMNSHASPHLATAGSGDVLSGIISGLLAQGQESFHAAAMASWLHGDIGVRAGRGLVADDMQFLLRQTLAELAHDAGRKRTKKQEPLH